jgi:transposase
MSQTIEQKRQRVRHAYDAAFKQAAVEHYQQRGGDLSRTAREMGVNHWTLRDWIDATKTVALPPAARTAAALAAENRRLQKELARVTEQRDILKKSLGILSTT